MIEGIVGIIEKPVEAGFQFIWAISFGQVITICLAVLGMIGGAVKLGSIILSLRAQHIELRKHVDGVEERLGNRMDNLVRDLAAIETETRQDVRDLRSAIHDLNKTLLAIKIIGVDVTRIVPTKDEEP